MYNYFVNDTNDQNPPETINQISPENKKSTIPDVPPPKEQIPPSAPEKPAPSSEEPNQPEQENLTSFLDPKEETNEETAQSDKTPAPEVPADTPPNQELSEDSKISKKDKKKAKKEEKKQKKSLNEQTPKKSNKKPLKIILLLLAIVVLLVIAALGLTVAAAYGYIDIGDEALQQQISFFVQDLPLTPKTIDYVFYKTVEAHSQQNRFKVTAVSEILLTPGPDIYSVVPEEDLATLKEPFSSNITAFIDYSDKEDVKIDTSLTIGEDIEADLLLLDQRINFKISSLPELPDAGLIDPDLMTVILNQVIGSWFYVEIPDQSDLEPMEELPTSKDFDLEESVESLTDEELEYLMSAFTLTEDVLGGKKHHKIQVDYDEEYLMKVAEILTGEEASLEDEMFTGTFSAETWVDASTFLLSKITFSGDIMPQDGEGISQTISSEITLSDYAQAHSFVAPQNARSLEDLFELIMVIMMDPEMMDMKEGARDPFLMYQSTPTFTETPEFEEQDPLEVPSTEEPAPDEEATPFGKFILGIMDKR
jgi:hypothetical protein